MDKFTYFHLCNHRIQKSAFSGETVLLEVHRGNDLVDTMINGAVVLELHEVRAIDYDRDVIEPADFFYDNDRKEQTYEDIDPEDGFYDESQLYNVNYAKYFKDGQKISEPLPPTFYEPILHNRIRWLVRPPIKYQVKAKVRYTTNSYDNYRPMECPVCDGRGWYIDILNKDGKFEVPTGIVKIAQRVVRNLLTKTGTNLFDSEFGTNIQNDVIMNSDDDNTIFNNVRIAVSQVEDQYLTDQQELINELPDDEILVSLSVDDVSRSQTDLRKVYLQLRIQTMTDDQVFKFGI